MIGADWLFLAGLVCWALVSFAVGAFIGRAIRVGNQPYTRVVDVPEDYPDWVWPDA